MTNNIHCSEGSFRTQYGNVYFKQYDSPQGTGVPLILVHGGPGFTHHYLEPLYPLASERPIILYDQLGCGKSDRPEDLSFCTVDYFVAELSALIEHISLEKVSLLGHSWGSAVVAEYAILNENVSHLILASPYMSSPLWNEDIRRYQQALPQDLRSAIESEDYSDKHFLKAHAEYYRRHVYGNTLSDRSISLSTQMSSALIYNTMWGKDEFSITGILKDYDCTDKIDRIRAKTLFIAGQYDTGSPRACHIMAKKLNGARVTILKECAHFPHLEKKSEYLMHLRTFLADENLKKHTLLDTLKLKLRGFC